MASPDRSRHRLGRAARRARIDRDRGPRPRVGPARVRRGRAGPDRGGARRSVATAEVGRRRRGSRSIRCSMRAGRSSASACTVGIDRGAARRRLDAARRVVRRRAVRSASCSSATTTASARGSGSSMSLDGCASPIGRGRGRDPAGRRSSPDGVIDLRDSRRPVDPRGPRRLATTARRRGPGRRASLDPIEPGPAVRADLVDRARLVGRGRPARDPVLRRDRLPDADPRHRRAAASRRVADPRAGHDGRPDSGTGSSSTGACRGLPLRPRLGRHARPRRRASTLSEAAGAADR